MVAPMFSIVIPTYNRAAILRRSLSHLLALKGIDRCEVIVIDDGSTDATPNVLAELSGTKRSELRPMRLDNGGPARARNAGVRAARGERILFIDDDVFPRDGMLQAHANLLDSGFTGSQGVLAWHKDVAPTPLIRYIDSRGSQFAFDTIRDETNLTFAHVYTGNFAVLREAVLQAGGFDETFTFSAFEDTVLGHRLQVCGAKLGFNATAIADHLHDMSEEEFLRREYKVGYMTGLLATRYPALAASMGVTANKPLLGARTYLLGAATKFLPLKAMLGFNTAMRLRHHEAFTRGLLSFRQERMAE